MTTREALDARLLALHALVPHQVDRFVAVVKAAFVESRLLVFAGNGGSAAEAEHMAAEYTGIGMPALALTVNGATLTAAMNDVGPTSVFSVQMYALRSSSSTPPLLIVSSTSGDSWSVMHAVQTAKDLGWGVFALLAGNGGRVRGLVGEERCLLVPTADVQIAQELHLMVQHMAFIAVRDGR